LGEEISIETEANEPYVFINWTDDNGKVISTKKNFSFTMSNKDVTLTANFE